MEVASGPTGAARPPTPRSSALPSPMVSSPSARPSSSPFQLGELVHDELTEKLSVSGLPLLRPGDCFELEYADSAHSGAVAIAVPSCTYPHRFEYVAHFDYREEFRSGQPSVTQRNAAYTRDCLKAVEVYTGLPGGKHNTPAAPFDDVVYSSLRQPVDSLETDCVLVTSNHRPTTRSFRAPGQS